MLSSRPALSISGHQMDPCPPCSLADDGKRSETAAVLFQYNVMGTRGPRKMKAIVPALASIGSPMKLLASSKAPSSILEW